jgi:hypothetical protein
MQRKTPWLSTISDGAERDMYVILFDHSFVTRCQGHERGIVCPVQSKKYVNNAER